jgi:hypothetical protein
MARLLSKSGFGLGPENGCNFQAEWALSSGPYFAIGCINFLLMLLSPATFGATKGPEQRRNSGIPRVSLSI